MKQPTPPLECRWVVVPGQQFDPFFWPLDGKAQLWCSSLMSQIAIVNMKVQPGKYEEAVAFMQKHIPDTASFEGCESIRVAGSRDGSTMMVYGE